MVDNSWKMVRRSPFCLFTLVPDRTWVGGSWVGAEKGMRGGETRRNKKVTSAKFTSLTHVHTCILSLESQCRGFNEGPLGIVGTSPQRAQGCWDWPGKGVESRGRGERWCVCVEVCVSLSSLLVQQLWEGIALWERSRGCFAGASQESFLDVCGVLGLAVFNTLKS